MKNKDKRYVEVIISYRDKIEILLDEYNNDYLLFQDSDSFQLSTAMCILQIGEYVGRHSDDFKTKNSQINWDLFKNMRNFITHQYKHVENYLYGQH